jgi:cysteine synthase
MEIKKKTLPAIAKNITELIGNTPMVSLSKFNKDLKGEIIVKLEYFNPLSSIKDRIAFSMIDKSEKAGKLKSGNTIIEPTSGNTGIGLAFVSAAKGYDLILTMPDTMSIERRKLLRALGAKVILTPGKNGMKGAIDKAAELEAENENYVLLQQFQNPFNPMIHKETTGVEIWDDTNGEVDIFVSGIGTGGTITGVGELLKSLKPQVKIIAVEPETSPVLSGGKPGPHKIQGIGAGFIPKVLKTELFDEVIKVSDADAFATSRLLALTEGILAGISSGAALYAGIQIAKREENRGKKIVVILPDTGERYLSTTLFDI